MIKIWKRLSNRDKHLYRNVAVILLLFDLVVGFICVQYYQQLQATIREESSSYLQEISAQISINVGRIATENYAMLSAIEMTFADGGAVSLSRIQEIVAKQKEHWGFRNLLLIDEQGSACNAQGDSVSLGGEAYLHEALTGNERPAAAPQIVNGEECILFTIPVDGVSVGTTPIRALGISYRFDTFRQALSVSAFGGQASTHIINPEGTVVIPSGVRTGENIGRNAFAFLDGVVLDGNGSTAAMKADIANGRGGQLVVVINGVRSYASYYPVQSQGWYLLSFVPVAAVNAKLEHLLRFTLLFCGVIALTVSALMCVLAITFLCNKRKLESIAFVDPVTGGDTIQRFYMQVNANFARQSHPQYAIIYINLEKFRLVNEQFGLESGDGVLLGMEAGIGSALNQWECMGHIMADNFCALAAYDNEQDLVARFIQWYGLVSRQMKQRGIDLICPPIQFGVYVVADYAMPLPFMVDRAKFALNSLTTVFGNHIRYAIYEEKVHQLLFREKQLEDRMEKALAEGEFHVYLQPKYLLETEQVGGAEALSRWKSSTEGMIFPDEFIPLFEKNGFVMQLDLWVFETVCKTIRSWIDAGLEPVKISVNCSRLHLRKLDFIAPYRRIFERYDIPARYIELELTESLVYENVRRLSAVIDEIHEIGFGCSIDDFGSGYSSLNLMQDIQADTLKLDKIFFRTAPHNQQRAGSVILSIINMAKALSMTTVAEGVELRSQVKMLRELGCDYIQGYVFARPMPIPDFEKLAFGDSCSKKEPEEVCL